MDEPNRASPRPRRPPYLCIRDIVAFVRDLDRSRRFYVDQLGFELILDNRVMSGEVGWIPTKIGRLDFLRIRRRIGMWLDELYDLNGGISFEDGKIA